MCRYGYRRRSHAPQYRPSERRQFMNRGCPCCSPELSALLGMMVSRRTVLKAGALFAGLSILPATKTVAATRLQPAEPPPAAPADVIFWGGPIVPVGGPRRRAAALAVRGPPL